MITSAHYIFLQSKDLKNFWKVLKLSCVQNTHSTETILINFSFPQCFQIDYTTP